MYVLYGANGSKNPPVDTADTVKKSGRPSPLNSPEYKPPGLKPPPAGLAYVVSGWRCCANDWAGTSSKAASAKRTSRRRIECGRTDMRPPTEGTVVAAGTLPADAGHAEGSPKA